LNLTLSYNFKNPRTPKNRSEQKKEVFQPQFFKMVGVKRQCSNFLHCIKALIDTVKDSKFQLLMENVYILYYNQGAA